MNKARIKNLIEKAVFTKSATFIVIHDTEKGGIYGTDSSKSSILSAGGISFIFDITEVKLYRDYTDHRTDARYTLNQLVEKVADRWGIHD